MLVKHRAKAHGAARVQLGLTRVLWVADEDRDEAVCLARQAHESYTRSRMPEQAAEVRAWLDAQP